MEASSLNFSVGSFNDDRRKSPVSRMVTLESVISWIQNKGFDAYTEKGLIDLASKYPTNSLISFKKNLNLMVGRVRKQRNEELGKFVDEIVPIKDLENGKEEDQSITDEHSSGF